MEKSHGNKSQKNGQANFHPEQKSISRREIGTIIGREKLHSTNENAQGWPRCTREKRERRDMGETWQGPTYQKTQRLHSLSVNFPLSQLCKLIDSRSQLYYILQATLTSTPSRSAAAREGTQPRQGMPRSLQTKLAARMGCFFITSRYCCHLLQKITQTFKVQPRDTHDAGNSCCSLSTI